MVSSALAGILGGPLGYAANKTYKSASKRTKANEKAQKKAIKSMTKSNQGRNDLMKWLMGAAGSKKDMDITRNPLYKQGSDYLKGILSGDPAASAAFEAPAMRQFQEQIMPEIAEKYAGAGAGQSSAFGQEMGQAGASLAERLQAMRAELQQNAVGQAMGYAQAPISNSMSMLSGALGQPSQIPYYQQQPGFGERLAGMGMQLAGQAAGTYFGGAMGGQAGGQLGAGLAGSSSPGGTGNYLYNAGQMGVS